MTDRHAKLLIDAVQNLSNNVEKLIGLMGTPDRYIDVTGMCEVLNMKKSAVYDRINRGEIPAHKVNGKMMISFNRLQELLPTIS